MPNSSATPASGEQPTLYDPPELSKDGWEQAGRRLLAKMIGEFAYEGIIQPEPEPEPDLRRVAEPDLGRVAEPERTLTPASEPAPPPTPSPAASVPSARPASVPNPEG